MWEGVKCFFLKCKKHLSQVVLLGFLLSSCLGTQPDGAQKAAMPYMHYLKKMKTLYADFHQQSTDDTGQKTIKKGFLWLSRPGKLKMVIEEPQREVFLVKDTWLIHHVPSVHETTHIPLKESPAQILLSADRNLENFLKKGIVRRDAQTVQLMFPYASGEAEGTLALVFHPGPVLKQWRIVDAFGLDTVVTLSHVRYNCPIPPSTFIFHKEDR